MHPTHQTNPTRCTDRYSCIDFAFENIRSETAEAREPADLRAIRALIETTPNGFEGLNLMVRRHLERWFCSHGTVKSSMRFKRPPRLTSSDSTGSAVRSGSGPERLSHPGSSESFHDFARWDHLGTASDTSTQSSRSVSAVSAVSGTSSSAAFRRATYGPNLLTTDAKRKLSRVSEMYEPNVIVHDDDNDAETQKFEFEAVVVNGAIEGESANTSKNELSELVAVSQV